MEKPPQFKRTSENAAGYPVLERVREEELPKDFDKLDKKQRLNLRTVLLAAGLSVLPMEAGDGSRDTADLNESSAVTSVETSEVEKDGSAEAIEKLASLETFANEISGYKAFTELQKDEVLYLDEFNRPVGEPVVLEDFTGSLPEGIEPKEGQAPVYLYSIGEVDETGLPIGKIPPRWLDYKQGEVQAEYPEQEITRRMNVVADFQAAYREADEPELVSLIASGEIDSYDEIVAHFVEKPVRGVEEYNRMEYAQKMIEFRSEPDEARGRPAVPSSLQDELRNLLPGLFAQESKFNAGLVSANDAAGLAQIVPKTWWEYTREKEFSSIEEQESEWEKVKDTVEVSLRMDKQLPVVGELFSDNYHYILHYAGEETMSTLRAQYETDEDFYVDFMAPWMVGAYNAGGPMVGKGLKIFIENTPVEDLQKGKELFVQIADYFEEGTEGVLSTYKDDAREYVSRVYANSAMLEEKYLD